ncbi:MAG: glycolate oxidase iron-sulfur subunit [Chloroflexi bacterium]|jgi:glycolate oxidase iron-sulfur subunit|nr:MAG: glycolate oxidase iron-sulfur subunit [Chloroflexota bacterium]
MRKIPGKIGQLHAQLPSLNGDFFRPSKESFRPKGQAKSRVGLLSGCVMPMTHGSTMEAVVRVLVRNKCEVVVPEAQVCCGALNLHGGDKEQAKEMARRNLKVFYEANIDAIIVASAGCGSTMKEYGDLLKNDSEYAEIAQVMSEKVKDISEFLVELPLDPPEGNLGISVTYQDPCHLAHAQRITDAPRKLLRSIPGVNLIELNSANTCCGAAGLYSTLQPKMSQELQRKKVESVLQVDCEVMATGNPGCAIQLENGLESAGSTIQVKHVIDLLDQSYNV